MRAGSFGASITIERVMNPPTAQPRRFGGLLDTVFTVALGTVCAFALTLGPAPLNTVAVTSAAAETFAQLEPAPAGVPLAADEVEADPPASNQGAKEDPAPWGSSEPVRPGPAVVDNSTGNAPVAPNLPGDTSSTIPTPAAPVTPPAQAVVDGAAVSPAVAIVEAYRTASGLPRFVTADACANPTAHSTVQVTPSALLPPGLAKKSLAPHPAFAAAEDNGLGAVAVTIYSCQ